jgi:hypothetical protein
MPPLPLVAPIPPLPLVVLPVDKLPPVPVALLPPVPAGAALVPPLPAPSEGSFVVSSLSFFVLLHAATSASASRTTFTDRRGAMQLDMTSSRNHERIVIAVRR